MNPDELADYLTELGGALDLILHFAPATQLRVPSAHAPMPRVPMAPS